MKKLRLLLVLISALFGAVVHGQTIKLSEGFETSDSLNLPAGWTKWSVSFPVDTFDNWTVRDTGLALPGLSTAKSKAHSGTKAVGVSWWTSLDTGGVAGIADAWLITKKIPNIVAGDSMKFWATGGTTSYADSLQIWFGVEDSLPVNQILHVTTLRWPVGSTYGLFSKYAIDLSIAQGFDLRVGFRFTGDFSVDGFFVHLDDITVEGPTSVNLVDPSIPERFGLAQNYPNPFNPTTTFEFQLPKSGYTTLKVYDAIGQEVATLAEGELSPGTFKAEWNATAFASGMYFARLTSGQYSETRKLMLMK